ncbi:MAG TPA: hypothetical protein VJR89_23760, partial [Polyangiales bacterium]|nr:hypothetical protein [Polyangiales bacterium]
MDDSRDGKGARAFFAAGVALSMLCTNACDDAAPSVREEVTTSPLEAAGAQAEAAAAAGTSTSAGLDPAGQSGRNLFRFETFGDQAFWGD